MRKLTLILSLLIIMTNGISQSQRNSDSLYQKLHQEVNIVNSSTSRSDVVWERIPLPEGGEIRSMKVMPSNKLYIGCQGGNIYQLDYDDWELINPSNVVGSQIEEYLDGGLIFSSAFNNYIWNYTDWTEIPKPFYGTVTKTFNFFFGGGGFEELYRSSDGCYNWDFVHDFDGCELVNGIVATSPDSIFLGYKNYCTGEGGVYLSTDSGFNFNPFGLHTHAISSLAIDNNNQVYAGSLGNWDVALPGLYKYNYQTEIWDIILIHGTISCIEFNTENHIYLGYGWEDNGNANGVMHSEDGGVSWIFDTIGMENGIVNDLQISENGIMYAIAGYPTNKLYRTTLPVNINEDKVTNHIIFNCYPNPTKTTFSISNTDGSKIQEVRLYNQLEQLMIRKKGISEDIDVSALERGLYIVEIVTEKGRSREKLLIQ